MDIRTEFATLGHFLSYAKERGATVKEWLTFDGQGRMVRVISVEGKNGGPPVLFEDMDENDRLTQGRILHLKRNLKLW